jgi:regulator of protease activity HflC (stomatin/prohibitin superfamily)
MVFNFGLGVLVLVILLLAWSLRILREYERAVVFQLGRFWMVKGPGLFVLIPAIQQMVRVDLRTVVLDVPPQDVITRDNVSVKVNAVVYFRVVDPQKAIIQVADFLAATSQLSQTTLRAVLGKHELDTLLAEREKLNIDIQKTLDTQTDAWGIKVSNVEKLLQAAQMLSKQPEAMQLRYLQTLSNIAGDKASTIVFPVPMDLITPMLEALKKRGA